MIMAELKTLKEIWESTITMERTYSGAECHAAKKQCFEDMREEAIKWIKSDIANCEKEKATKRIRIADQHRLLPGKTMLCKCDGYEVECEFHREGLRMMHFFNLTESDIK